MLFGSIRKLTRPRHSAGLGFSLLEISVVLIIISTIIGVGVAYLGLSVEKAQRDTTTQRMQAIQKALLDYRRAFGAIPCPSDITLAVTNTAFGRGNLTTPCDAGTTDPNYNGDMGPDVWVGGVPVRTLKLPDEYAFDGWGRRFTYAVDQNFTSAMNITGFHLFAVDSDPGTVPIADGNGNTITSNALYAIVSHGPNGHGAFTRYGTARVNASSSNTYEQQNCGCNASAVYTLYGSFVQGPYTTDTADSTDTFDDIVVYGTRRSLRHATE
ncbi:MAG: type II secretion system protein [Alphaproteobacteria bacterium]